MTASAPSAHRLAELEAEVAALRERLGAAEKDTDRTLLRATRLAQIVSALGQVDPSGRTARVAGEVAELFDAEIGLLLLGADTALRVAGRWGVADSDLTAASIVVPAAIAEADREVVAGPVADVPVPAELAAFAPTHVAWIRLRVHERTIGSMLLARCHPQPFTSSDEHELRAVGARVALAVENADLQRRTEDQLEQLHALHRMSAGLAGTVVPGEAGRLAVQTLRSLDPEASATVLRVTAEGRWEQLAHEGPEPAPTLADGDPPWCEDPGVEVRSLRDGYELVGAIALRSLAAHGSARAALPHVQHIVGLSLGKAALHERTAVQARQDALTGLPNRVELLERIDAALRARRPIAVIFLDLDRFKLINDSLGHDVGDELLVEVAQRLQRALRPGDLVGRLGGDEFIVLCDGITSAEQAGVLADRIGHALAEPLDLHAGELHISASQGIALSGPDVTADSLLRDADAAMYRAKARGKDRYEVFDERLRDEALGRLRSENALHEAVRQHRLRARYQPVVDLRTGRCLGVEAVPCYEDADGKLVPWSGFAEVAEESELVVTLGRWLLHRACHDLAAWTLALGADAPPRVIVNVSGRELARDDHLESVRTALADAGLPATRLGIELTESVLLHGGDRVRSTLVELHRAGVEIGMDDFGSGYSSLTFLRKYPIDLVKIGQRFVEGVVDDTDAAAIAEAVVRLADVLELRCVADGIGDTGQLEVVRALGCGAGQGPVFGDAYDAEAMQRRLGSGPFHERQPSALLP